MWKIRLVALALLLLGVALGFFSYASERGTVDALKGFPFRLGLDLRGGSHLVYRADVSHVANGDVSGSLDALRDVIERRVNLFGVSEPLVQLERGGLTSGSSEERLIVELPGVTDLNEAVQIIGQTPLLDFRLMKQGLSASSTPQSMDEIFERTELTGRLITKAAVEFDPTSRQPLVVVQFNGEGQALFASITKTNVGRQLGIFLDNQLISNPVIQEEIPSGSAQISGGFTPESARQLVRDLNYGALPVPIELVSTQSIGASLGEEALARSVNAGLWGFALVVIFLLLWYRLPGLIAALALSLYVVLNLALFKLIPVTLTAAGLAAFILSIGMAVDANILIFERMKEELKRGRNLEDAMREGFARAWLSIRDSNISSIITGVILFWFGGTAVIKGFALVFVIGVITSMFTAISVTRTFLLSLGLLGNVGSVKRFLFGSGIH